MTIMTAFSSLPAMDYITLAGCYSFYPSDLIWESLPFGRKPRFAGEKSALYQGTLRSQKQDERPIRMSLRVALCGMAWLGEHTFGRGPKSDLLTLQQMLDEAPSVQTQLARLYGDFLLSYISPDLSCCWLFRNITGMRTLYYRQYTLQFCWSTSIADLFEDSPTLDDVDLAQLPLLVTAAHIQPTQTCYRGIFSLPAGHGIQVRADGSMHTFSDDFVIPDHQRLPMQDATEALRFLMKEAFRHKLQGISRVGILLSGGLDSAIVAQEALQHTQSVRGLHWSWDALPVFRDEKACAEAIANQLQIELSLVECSAFAEVGGDHLRCMEALALPHNHSFFRSFLETAKVAANHDLPVVLSGHMGDLLFTGDWKDGFRSYLSATSPYNPLSIIKMMWQLLSWYPRIHAFQTALDLIRGRTRQVREPPSERIQRCQSWLTTEAFERVVAAGEYAYQQVHPSLSTQMTYQSIKEEINGSADIDTNLLLHAFLPNNTLLLHPYGDRSLMEFCLGLAPHHRAGFAAGQRISKLLLRLAYLGDLPSSIIGREVRLPYASVQPYYCLNNQAELQTVFGPDPYLVEFGIIDPACIASLLTDTSALMDHSGSLVPAAAVELWLRHIAGVPLLPPKIASSGRRRAWLPSLDQNVKRKNSMLAFPPTILAKEVNGFLVLINEITQDVIELSQEASLLLAVLQDSSSWSVALASLRHQWQDEQEAEAEVDEQGIRAFVSTLQQDGWIIINEHEGASHGF
jgi:asparagine synthase (glutamine-hydrolysing)